jgi:putative glycosyltransferase (TIGR04348 family)
MGHGSWRGTIGIVHPGTQGIPSGNLTTAERWSGMFEQLGWSVFRTEIWDGRPCDILVALHARKSHDSVLRFHREYPGSPILVAGTGTDLYSDIEDGGAVRESLGFAWRIVVLQPLAVLELPQELRQRARVIHQSVPARSQPPEPRSDVFEVAFLANIRPVKDPLCAVRAAKRLPASSSIRIVHMGVTIDPDLGEELAREAARTSRFTSLGSRPREEALERLANSRLLLSTSRHEGGANVLSEALALDVPILATRIPGSIGVLGEDYPGTFAVGDDAALAELLLRAETDAAYLADLRAACRERAWLVDPRTELESWKRLLDELATESVSTFATPGA